MQTLRMSQIQHFCNSLLKDYQSLNLRNIVSVSYQAYCTCDMPQGITQYFKQCLIKKCTFAVLKLSQGPHRMVVRDSMRQ